MPEQEPLVFESLSLAEIPVQVAEENYVLVEASAEVARMWRANNLQSLQMEERGRGKNRVSQSVFKGTIADSHLLLVSMCFFKVHPDGNRTPVKMDTLRGWKNSIVTTLFKRLRDISDLSDAEDDEDPEKNSPTTSGSGPKLLGESADEPSAN